MTSLTEHEQYVEFSVGDESYAIRISEIHEIIRMQHITDIPGCRSYITGVINLRGRIVPVVNLRALFNMHEDVGVTKTTRIIVLKHKDESVGIIVDVVNRVTTFTDIQPPPERLGSISGAYFTGIGLSGQALVGIMKLDELLIQE